MSKVVLYSLNVVDVADCYGGKDEGVIEDDVRFHYSWVLEKKFDAGVDLEREEKESDGTRCRPEKSKRERNVKCILLLIFELVRVDSWKKFCSSRHNVLPYIPI